MIVQNFLREFRPRLRDLVRKHRVSDIYLFLPDAMKRPVHEAFPAAERRKLRKQVHGIYTNRPRLALLRMIRGV